MSKTSKKIMMVFAIVIIAFLISLYVVHRFAVLDKLEQMDRQVENEIKLFLKDFFIPTNNQDKISQKNKSTSPDKIADENKPNHQ